MLHLVNLVQQGVQLAEIWSKQNQFSLLLGLQTPSTRAEITCSKPLIVPLQHVGKQIKHAHYEKNHYEFIHARYDKRVPTPHNNLYEARNQPRVRRHEWFLLPEAIHTISFHGHQHLNLRYIWPIKDSKESHLRDKKGAANHQSLPWPLTSSLDIIHSFLTWMRKKLHVPKCLLSPRMNWPTSMTAQRGGKNCQRWVRNRRKLWRQTKQNWLCFAKEFLPTWAVISLQR